MGQWVGVIENIFYCFESSSVTKIPILIISYTEDVVVEQWLA